jgi:hypothetical protein
MQLGVERMVNTNRETFKTDFQVSVDAARNITTGISAADRAETIRIMADPASMPEDLVQPGHVFPLRARPGGVLQRAGHTEAAVDLVTLAGCRPIAVICEVMSDDGSMARLPELLKFAKKHKLKLASIEELIQYRRTREKLVERVEAVKMPTDYGEFQLYLYRSKLDEQHHLALVKGDLNPKDRPLVRVHSECLTGDVFGSRRCDCGPQLHQAMRQVSEAGSGVILYMRQEGRGIGLPAKIKAYKLQESGLDTVQANLKLGYGMDVSLEMSGYNSSLNNAIAGTRRGGEVVLFGLHMGDWVVQHYEQVILKGLTLYSVIGREIFRTWTFTQRLLEDADNGIQAKIFDVLLRCGQGTILDIEDFEAAHFEAMMRQHPKILLRFADIHTS